MAQAKKKAPAKKQAVVVKPVAPTIEQELDALKAESARLQEEITKELKATEPVGKHAHGFLAEVQAEEYFCDGMLATHFAEYGYPPEWRQGEVRKIPLSLYDRCVQSGGEFVVLNG